MPRIARVVALGLPHHITQRGNYGQRIFIDDKDRTEYLCWVQEYSNKFDLSMLTYDLMLNHIHFIGIPEKEDSLAKTFNCAHMRYAQYFNKRMGAKGHLWQGRFYSCVLDEKHLIVAAKYIERNPVRAGLVEKPWDWKWSSAALHVGIKNNSIIKLDDLLNTINMSSDNWKNYITNDDDNRIINEIRKKTLTGRPMGNNEFIRKLEIKFGKRLHALPKGRPVNI